MQTCDWLQGGLKANTRYFGIQGISGGGGGVLIFKEISPHVTEVSGHSRVLSKLTARAAKVKQVGNSYNTL